MSEILFHGSAGLHISLFSCLSQWIVLLWDTALRWWTGKGRLRKSVGVQSRMKSRTWSFDLSAGHFGQTVVTLHLVLGFCQGH